jgi:hypothetical protein
MSEKSLPQKPTNLCEYDCDLKINNQHFTKLEISPYYEKHNREYLEALERKGIKLSAKELAEKLITDNLIRKILLPQLNGKEEIIADGRSYQYTYYYYAPLYKGIKAYKLVWCATDNEPHILGIMDCFRIREYDRK